MSRLSDLVRVYALLDRLKHRLGGPRNLASFAALRDRYFARYRNEATYLRALHGV
jgi:hypothetical protein